MINYVVVLYHSHSFCVGAHPQLAHYCKLTFRQLLCWGPGLKLKNACYKLIFIQLTTVYIKLLSQEQSEMLPSKTSFIQ
ncbi:TPA: hypothetical protein ACOGH0_002740, partial [Staphylococcus aureus]